MFPSTPYINARGTKKIGGGTHTFRSPARYILPISSPLIIPRDIPAPYAVAIIRMFFFVLAIALLIYDNE